MMPFSECWIESPTVQVKKSSVEVPEATLRPFRYTHYVIADAAAELAGGSQCGVISWDLSYLAPTPTLALQSSACWW